MPLKSSYERVELRISVADYNLLSCLPNAEPIPPSSSNEVAPEVVSLVTSRSQVSGTLPILNCDILLREGEWSRYDDCLVFCSVGSIVGPAVEGNSLVEGGTNSLILSRMDISGR